MYLAGYAFLGGRMRLRRVTRLGRCFREGDALEFRAVLTHANCTGDALAMLDLARTDESQNFPKNFDVLLVSS